MQENDVYGTVVPTVSEILILNQGPIYWNTLQNVTLDALPVTQQIKVNELGWSCYVRRHRLSTALCVQTP